MPTEPPPTPLDRLQEYTLMDALLDRRSRRVALGMKIPAGPLAYTSPFPPAPLTEDEEAALAFAACGITGHALADLCYAPGHGGNIMAGLVGRTIASGDGLQTVALVVTNDKSTCLLKRPRDFAAAEIHELIELARRRDFTGIYRLTRVKIKDGRSAPPKEPLFNISANRWSAYAPGTTYFLPVNDLTFMCINGLLEILNEETGVFILDERAGYRPAGLGAFAKSKGGHLRDDPREGRVLTMRMLEQFVTEFVTVEQGMMLQNLGLMAQALGLGGFPNFANHEFAWFEALGFRMGKMPVSQYLGAGPLVRFGLKMLGKDVDVPFPMGLERDGQVLLKPFCPPYYANMAEAVHAVLEAKCGPNGAMRANGDNSGWRNSKGVAGQITAPSQAAINATIAYCEYAWKRYGRFPVHL
ncbi:MAG TPA: hypothetical protein VHH73_06210, partial [Verrucomicrobiae bacterium]|nr:hypothetical protein [Verrucomicrobiae bacterium]